MSPEQTVQLLGHIKLLLPLAGCAVLAIVFEQALYRLDLTYMPLWRPSLMCVIIGIASLIWSSWVSSIPMENILLNKGENRSSLATSIILFFLVVAIVLGSLAWTAGKRIITDNVKGGVSRSLTAIRFVPIVCTLVLTVWAFSRANNMVGSGGLVALLMQ